MSTEDCASGDSGDSGVDGAGADGERAGPEAVEETVAVPLVIPQVAGELDEDAASGDAPELSDVLHDIGEDSLKESGPYRTKPAPKFFRLVIPVLGADNLFRAGSLEGLGLSDGTKALMPSLIELPLASASDVSGLLGGDVSGAYGRLWELHGAGLVD